MCVCIYAHGEREKREGGKEGGEERESASGFQGVQKYLISEI